MNLISVRSLVVSVKRTWIADDAAELGAEFRGDATRHAARGDTARLRAADQSGDAASGGEA